MGIQQFCTVVFLLDAGWRDWRRREISLTLTALFGAAGLLNSIIQGRDIKDFLIPAGIGLMFLTLGILSGGALGAGDGLLLLALGLASDTGEYLGTLLEGCFWRRYGRAYFWLFSGKAERQRFLLCLSSAWIYRRAAAMMKNLKWNRGSLTVEAACVMSLILLAVMGLIYLFFFVHNRAWLTAAAYESALAGSMDGIREEGRSGDTARMRGRELGSTGFSARRTLMCR